MRRAAALGIVLAAMLLGAAGCGQLTLRGAADPCPREPGLRPEEIEACWKDQSTVLTAGDEGDRTAGGWLRGEALPVTGRLLRHVVALDYSGSMWGGYRNPEPSPPPCGWRQTPTGRARNSPYYWEQAGFSSLLADGPLAALADGHPVHPMTFNRQVTVLGRDGFSTFDPGRGAFLAELPGPVLGREAVLRALIAPPMGRLPADPAAAAFGDPSETHLNEVLDAAAEVFESFEDRDGVLWIVTDNIIERQPHSGSGDLDLLDVRYNRRFYQTLRSDPRWQVVYAWPIHRAPWLCGSTLMVYGMYYSSRERIDERSYRDLCVGDRSIIGHPNQLETFRRFAHPGSPSPGSPFKLKPDNIDVVRLSFLGQVRCREIEIGREGACLAKLQIRNLLNHRQVEEAHFSLSSGRCEPWGLKRQRLQPVRTAVPMCAGGVRQDFELAEPIPPQGSRILEVRFTTPPIETSRQTLADHWESASFSRFLMIGRMSVAIRELRTAMVIEEKALAEVYGVDSLPEIFRNPSTEDLDTSICLNLVVDNPSFLASLLLLALLLLIAVAVLAAAWFLKPSYRIVEVDGSPEGRIRLVRFAWTPLLLRQKRIGKARLTLRGEPKVVGDSGHKIQKSGGAWSYSSRDDIAVARIALLRRRRRPSVRRDDDF